MARSMAGDAAGTTTLEFALLGMVVVLLLVGMVQVGLIFWSWQALQGAATDAARCAAINATSCQNVATTPANTQTYASAAATTRGLTGVTSSNVTVTTGAAAQTLCNTTLTGASVVSVAVSYPFGMTFLSVLPSSITASACFPMAS